MFEQSQSPLITAQIAIVVEIRPAESACKCARAATSRFTAVAIVNELNGRHTNDGAKWQRKQ